MPLQFQKSRRKCRITNYKFNSCNETDTLCLFHKEGLWWNSKLLNELKSCLMLQGRTHSLSSEQVSWRIWMLTFMTCVVSSLFQPLLECSQIMFKVLTLIWGRSKLQICINWCFMQLYARCYHSRLHKWELRGTVRGWHCWHIPLWTALQLFRNIQLACK